MKVKDIVNKIRLIGTEVVIKEKFVELSTSKVPLRECEYLERTVLSIQPLENKIEINIKPLD
ncbi:MULTISPECIES: hypothetical protein [unclassified Clostridium]|uniref:hypothetical protein n=1 Tax=unclassified Clostridium TaxID=2614128 RepID=UPI0025BA078C|nr:MULTISPECIES: hypothetical protein [unclassified Clostridium]